MEVSGAYTPEVSAHHPEISGHSMAIVSHAAVLEMADWDEVGAFFHTQRNHVSPLSGIFPDIWYPSAWCESYHSRLQVRPLTSDGLAPPFVTAEDFNQGDNFSGDG